MSKSNISSKRIGDVNILTGRRVRNLNSERFLAISDYLNKDLYNRRHAVTNTLGYLRDVQYPFVLFCVTRVSRKHKQIEGLSKY